MKRVLVVAFEFPPLIDLALELGGALFDAFFEFERQVAQVFLRAFAFGDIVPDRDQKNS